MKEKRTNVCQCRIFLSIIKIEHLSRQMRKEGEERKKNIKIKKVKIKNKVNRKNLRKK